jgi:hypothetical protein
MAEAFYLMYNPHALQLMREDVLFAPQYFDLLYNRAHVKNDFDIRYAITTEAETTTSQTKASTARSQHARTGSKAAGAA